MANAVLLFPGQGSQSVGMCQELFDIPTFAQTFDEASQVLGTDMKALTQQDPNKHLDLTSWTQPALLTASTAIYRALHAATGVQPVVVAGHSLGEYSALVALGALDFAQALLAVHKRGAAMQAAVPVGVGAMAAYIGGKFDEVKALCATVSTPTSQVEIANYNSSQQIVLSGHKEAVDKAAAAIAENKWGKCIPLKVSAPFHSSLMAPAAGVMASVLKDTPLHPFQGALVANVDAQWHTTASYSREHLVKQVQGSVLWLQTLQLLAEKCPEDTHVWAEVGPGSVLQGLAKKSLPNAQVRLSHSRAEFEALCAALAN